MEEEIYLTPNLYIRENATHYMDDEKNKEVRVNKNNWHKYLEEYGWMKLDKGWIRRLNQYCQHKNKNSCYGVLDCGGSGDCLFYCIAEAIKEPDMNVIRSLAAKEITDDNFEIIIESYRVAYDINDFDCEWDPHEIETKEQLQEELKKSGHNYWGDYIVIQLLEKALNCNFIILNAEKEEIKRGTLKERFNIHSLGDEYDSQCKSIILYYIDGVHFQLVGYFDGGCMRTVFEDIPLELYKIYKEDCRGK